VTRCMVLNASYEYLNIEDSWFDSLMLVLEGKAVPIEHYPEVVRSQHCTFQLPAVVVMRYQVVVKKRTKLFQMPTKKAVFIRDNFECQYCGARLTMGAGTRDHVVPRALKGPDSLANVVASCKPCNGRKANRTPEQAGMVLRSKPRPLTDEEKIRCVLKTCRSKERQTWLGCLKRLGITLWSN
jgi:5-methylcytosine-specific restriction endonuclease McrA